MVLALLFDASLSLDVDHYDCLALSLTNLPAVCGTGGCEPEKFPVQEPCVVTSPSIDGATAGTVRAPVPAPGTLLMLAVRAVDRAGNVSEWTGGD